MDKSQLEYSDLSDVLAGVVIGTVLALVSVWLVKKIQGQKKLVK